MNITISQNTKSSRVKKNHLQNRFDKLFQQVKKKQLANEKLKSDLTELHRIYLEKILPKEKVLAKPYSLLTQRLIDFFGRKSLAQWQRQELAQWILECIENVDPTDPQEADNLRQQYQQVLADFFQIDADELEKQFSQSMDELGGNLDDMDFAIDDDPPYQEDLFGFSENEKDQDPDFDTFFEEFDEQDFAPELSAPKNITNDNWLKVLFRRTANVLHPDKENNKTKKLEKEKLMSVLLIARKQNDIITLLNMYTKFVDSSELKIDKNTMQDLCNQLESQKLLLEEESIKIIYQDPMNTLLYENFHSHSKKTRDNKIEAHIDKVNILEQDLRFLAADLRNLKALKIHLEKRYHSNLLLEINDEWLDNFNSDF